MIKIYIPIFSVTLEQERGGECSDVKKDPMEQFLCHHQAKQS